ncbi:MAG: hypothetical protein N4A44_03890 [Alphaproteobacteria bacterium]|jgi:acyl carrier protein|nr:hypothetical protein [Alphaproteobacteria bacterium]
MKIKFFTGNNSSDKDQKIAEKPEIDCNYQFYKEIIKIIKENSLVENASGITSRFFWAQFKFEADFDKKKLISLCEEKFCLKIPEEECKDFSKIYHISDYLRTYYRCKRVIDILKEEKFVKSGREIKFQDDLISDLGLDPAAKLRFVTLCVKEFSELVTKRETETIAKEKNTIEKIVREIEHQHLMWVYD